MRRIALAAFCLVVACGTPEETDDGGVLPDSGVQKADSGTPATDAGVFDAGAPVTDGGVTLSDAGTDAGSVDAGGMDASVALDSGVTDAGAADAGSLDAGSVDSGTSESGTLDSGLVDAGPPPDFDNDGTPDSTDTDDDNDCIPDLLENTADTDSDGTPDFHDRDSDGDRLADGAEDVDCNGTRNGIETSSVLADTDNDGASDLVELVSGTDANSASANPAANGDLVIVAPYQRAPVPSDQVAQISTKLKSVDLYVLYERSSLQSDENAIIKTNLSSVLGALRCPPAGTGAPSTCISDIWAGAGAIGFDDSAADTFRNYVDISSSPNFTSLDTTVPTSTGFRQASTYGLYATMTGAGTNSLSCSGLPTLNSRATCGASPAGSGGYLGYGYPCFREGALPLVALMVSESPLNGTVQTCPAWSTVVLPTFTNRHAKLLGLYSDNSSPSGTAETLNDLSTMATATKSLNLANNNTPFVFSANGSAASTALQNGVISMMSGLGLDVSLVVEDDQSDAVNATSAFVDHIETYQPGSSACANGLNDIDTNSDTHDDAFVNVRTGTPICWLLQAKTNTTVQETVNPQLFRVTLRALGETVTELDSVDVFFVVPPVAP